MRRSSARGSVSNQQVVIGILRSLLVIVLGLTLADPRLLSHSDRVNVFFCLDVSESIPGDQRLKAERFINQTASQMQFEDLAGFIVFGKEALLEVSLRPKLEALNIKSIVNPNNTNIHDALQLAIGRLPQLGKNKIVVFSILTTVSVIFLFGILIFLLDYRQPPKTNATTWHAYLTDEERQHPLAKYWYSRADINPKVLEALRSGPLEKSEVMKWEDRFKLLEPGYQSAENGWRVMEDGSGYVAVLTFFPGATSEMIDWWFVWAQKEEDIRYKIWYPGAHYAMAEMLTPGAPEYPDAKPYWGKSRFPVEDVGMGTARIRLDFVPPSEFGFEELPEGSTMMAVRVGVANGIVKHTDMIHYIRPIEGGVEMRSRFWMVRDLEPMSGGLGLAALGAGLAMGVAAIGSGIGVGIAGAAGAGVIAEDSKKFGPVPLRLSATSAHLHGPPSPP